QIRIIEDLKKEGLDYLIIIPSEQKKLARVINELHSEGIKTICVDIDIPESKRIAFIGTDNYEAGIFMGNLIARNLEGKGKVVLSTTILSHKNLQERLQGIYDVLAKYPDIQIVG